MTNTATAVRLSWQYFPNEVEGEGAEMIAVHNGRIIVLHDFRLSAVDLAGRGLWESEPGDFESSGSAVLAFTDDTVVVEGGGTTKAYDLRTGDSRPVPTGLVYPPSKQSVLLPGYTADDGVLRYEGRALAELEPTSFPEVGRLGNVTIINDFELGLFAVDDSGTELLRVDMGEGEHFFDNCNIVIVDGLAVTVGSDGVVYAFSPA